VTARCVWLVNHKDESRPSEGFALTDEELSWMLWILPDNVTVKLKLRSELARRQAARQAATKDDKEG
jgi:hypothetical protein